jgi:hypothetical protein
VDIPATLSFGITEKCHRLQTIRSSPYFSLVSIFSAAKECNMMQNLYVTFQLHATLSLSQDAMWPSICHHLPAEMIWHDLCFTKLSELVSVPVIGIRIKKHCLRAIETKSQLIRGECLEIFGNRIKHYGGK